MSISPAANAFRANGLPPTSIPAAIPTTASSVGAAPRVSAAIIIMSPDGRSLGVLDDSALGSLLGGAGRTRTPQAPAFDRSNPNLRQVGSKVFDLSGYPQWVTTMPDDALASTLKIMGRNVEFTTMDKVPALNRAQSFFQKLGVTESHGNDKNLPVVVQPRMDNAAFVALPGDRRTGFKGAEFLQIGTHAETGTSYMNVEDVLYHEYSHRVVNKFVDFSHDNPESGALNESLADTFAAAIDGNLTMGEKIGTMRDMLNPGKDVIRLGGDVPAFRSPAHIHELLPTTEPHINMGIPNKAAALIGTKLGVDKMADIYINALDKYLKPESGFADAAQATFLVASEKYGKSSREALAVQQAWQAVGITPGLHGVSSEPMPADGPRVNIVE